MDKTLLKHFPKENIKTHSTGSAHGYNIFPGITPDMRGYLEEAANDLLEPRMEAVRKLLNSIKIGV